MSVSNWVVVVVDFSAWDFGTQKRGPVCGMRAALSRRHVHGLRFQPPATGCVHRIAGGVAQEPADAECRHAAARVAIAPPENPRLHVTLHPVTVIAYQAGEVVKHVFALFDSIG